MAWHHGELDRNQAGEEGTTHPVRSWLMVLVVRMCKGLWSILYSDSTVWCVDLSLIATSFTIVHQNSIHMHTTDEALEESARTDSAEVAFCNKHVLQYERAAISSNHPSIPSVHTD